MFASSIRMCVVSSGADITIINKLDLQLHLTSVQHAKDRRSITPQQIYMTVHRQHGCILGELNRSKQGSPLASPAASQGS